MAFVEMPTDEAFPTERLQAGHGMAMHSHEQPGGTAHLGTIQDADLMVESGGAYARLLTEQEL
jgi:hypothetical protein